MAIEAGELRERFAFEKRGDLSGNSPPGDGYGNVVDDTWTEQFDCRAKLHILRGGESVVAARLEGRKMAILTVRSSTNTKLVSTAWRCKDKRTLEFYNIREVTLQPDKHDFEMLIELGVNPG